MRGSVKALSYELDDPAMERLQPVPGLTAFQLTSGRSHTIGRGVSRFL